MSTINKYSEKMIYEKLVILTNLFLEKYPEVTPFVYIETASVEGHSIIRLNADWDKIYEKLSTQKEKNALAKLDISLYHRVDRFIKTNYEALQELDRYYLYFHTKDLTETDLQDMNKTYRKLKNKKTGIVWNILRK